MRPKLDLATAEKYWKSSNTMGQSKDPNAIHPESLSQYDKGFIVPENNPYEQLNENRANKQTGLDKFGNGLVNMGTSAFTGALESVVGLAYGTGSAIINTDPHKFYDNEFTASIIDPINEWAKKEMPFYYSQHEQESRNPVKGIIPGTEGSGNFWFDKVLGNTGYTLGSFAVGFGASKLLGLSKAVALGEEVSSAAEGLISGKLTNAALKQGKITLGKQAAIGGIMGYSESSQEARSTYKDTKENLIKLRASGDPKYKDLTDDRIEELSYDAASTNFLINLPVTGALDMMLFSKWINPGAKAEIAEYNKITKKIAQDGTEELVDATLATPKWKRALISGTENYFKSFAKEGGQEMTQHASNIVAQHFVDKHGIQNKDWFDSITSGLAEGVGETLTTKEGWEEGLVGGLTGGLFGIGQGNTERLTREANTKAKIEALKNTDWNQLNDRAKSFVSAVNQLQASEESKRNGDLFEAKNKAHEALVTFAMPLIKTGNTDILKEKLEMLKQTPLAEFNKAFGFNENSDAVKQNEEVDKLLNHINNLEQDYNRNLRLFGNNELTDTLTETGAIIKDADAREEQIAKEIREKGGEAILHLRAMTLQPNAYNQSELLKAIDYNEYRKQKENYRKDYNKAVENLNQSNPVNAPEIKQLLADLNRVAERREAYVQAYNDLQNPEKGAASLMLKQLKKINEQAQAQKAKEFQSPTTEEDAKEVIKQGDRTNEVTTPDNKTLDLSKLTDEELSNINASVIDDLSKLDQSSPEYKAKEAFAMALSKENDLRTHGDDIVKSLRDKYKNAVTPEEKQSVIDESKGLGYTIDEDKHIAQLGKLAKAREEFEKRQAAQHSDTYHNTLFKGQNEFKEIIIFPEAREEFEKLVNDPEYKDKLTLLVKQGTAGEITNNNDRVGKQKSDLALHLQYEGKDLGFVVFYNTFTDKQTGETIDVETLTPKDFLKYFGEGHPHPNSQEFINTYRNAKDFYNTIREKFEKNGKKDLVLTNTELKALTGFSISGGKFHYVDYGEEYKTLDTYPIYIGENGKPLIVDTVKGTTVGEGDDKVNLPATTMDDEVYEVSEDKTSRTVNIIYSRAFDVLNRIMINPKSGQKLMSRYLALVEQVGGPIQIGKKTYQWVALTPNSIHDNMDAKLDLVKGYSKEGTVPVGDENKRRNQEINDNLFIAFGLTNSYGDGKFRVSLQPNYKNGGVTVKIWSPVLSEAKNNTVYLNVHNFKDFKDFLNQLEAQRKTNTLLANTTPFTERSFKENVRDIKDGQATQFGVTVEPNNKNKHLRLEFIAKTNQSTKSKVDVSSFGSEIDPSPEDLATAQALSDMSAKNVGMSFDEILDSGIPATQQPKTTSGFGGVIPGVNPSDTAIPTQEKQESKTKGPAPVKNTPKPGSKEVFSRSPYTAQQLIHLDKAFARLREMLPSSIKAEELNQIEANIKSGVITWGSFKDGIIKLNRNAELGTEYHEAFHAVFRTFLSNEEQNELYDTAKKELQDKNIKDKKTWNSVRKEFLQANPEASDLSEQQLDHLILEEYMADKFKSWATKEDAKPKTLIGKLWQKIKDLYNLFTGNNNLDVLFGKIYSDKFKNAQPVINRFSANYKQVDANSRIKVNEVEDEDGNLVPRYLSSDEQIRWTNTIVAGVLRQMDEGPVSFNEAFNNELATWSKYFEYGPKWEYIYEDSTSSSIERAYSNLLYLFTNPEAIAELRKEALNTLRPYNVTEEDEADTDHNENSKERSYDRNQENTGGFASLTQAIKKLMATTTYQTSEGELLGLPRIPEFEDKFEKTITVAADPKAMYNGLTKLCQNQLDLNGVLNAMATQMKYDNESSHFINRVFQMAKVDTSGGVMNYDNVDEEGIILLQRVAQAFNLYHVNYRFTLFDPHSKLNRTFFSTLRDVVDEQLGKWSVLYENGDKNPVVLYNFYKQIEEGPKGGVYTNEQLSKEVDAYHKGLSKLGITLSKGYIEYLLISSAKVSRNDAQNSIYNTFSVSTNHSIITIVDDLKNIHDLINNHKNNINDSESKHQGPFKQIKNSEDATGTTGALTRLKHLAEDNAIFDQTVQPSSYVNAEGKPVYAYQSGTYHIVKTLELARNYDWTPEVLAEKAENDPKLKYLVNNFLITNPAFQNVRHLLEISRTDGIKESSLSEEGGEIKANTQLREAEGVTFSGFSPRDFLLNHYAQWLKKTTVIGLDGKPVTLRPTTITIMGESSTSDTIDLPEHNFVDQTTGEINQSFITAAYNEIQRELDRINRVKAGEFKDKYVAFNDTDGARGYKFWADNKLILDYISNKFNVPNLAETLIEKGSLDEYKDILEKGIRSYFEDDFNDHLTTLFENGLITKDKEGKFVALLLPREYHMDMSKHTDKKQFTTDNLVNNLKYVYLNDYMNTLAINQLYAGDPAMSLKNFEDKFKRDKLRNASGKTTELIDLPQNLQGDLVYSIFGTYNGSKFEDIQAEDHSSKSRMDAQGYGSVDLARRIYTALGRMTPRAHEIYTRIDEGEPISKEDHKYLKDMGLMLNSIKMVYHNGDEILKLSVAILTKEFTSRKDKNGKWVAQMGQEWLHNLREEMSNKGTHLLGPPSLAKEIIKNPIEVGDDLKVTIQDKNKITLDPRYFKLQQENPSNKIEGSDPTQMEQILVAEQKDPALVDHFQRLLGERTSAALIPVRYYISQMTSKGPQPKLRYINAMFRQALEKSGASDALLEFTETNANGEPIRDFNDQNVVQKFEEMITAHFNKAMSHKIPQYKTTAQSDFGYNVIVDKNGKVIPRYTYLASPETYENNPNYTTRRLQVVREDNSAYGECVLPAHFAELFGLKAGDEIPAEIAKLFAVRIPSQDKHSAMPLRIVDILPKHMGSNIIVPVELIELTGSDFDIDSFYCHRMDFYIKDSRFMAYGNSEDSKWEQFKIWNKKNNKLAKDLVNYYLDNKLYDNNAYLTNADLIDDLYARAFRELGLPSTESEFDKSGLRSLGEINNDILDAKIALHSNEHTLDESNGTAIARTPATVEEFEKALDSNAQRLGFTNRNEMGKPYTTSSLNGKLKAFTSISSGKEGIGVAVNSSKGFAALSKHGVDLNIQEGTPNITIESGDTRKVLSNIKDVLTISGKRIMDVLSTVTSAQTDNAKHEFNGKAKLNVSALGPVDAGIMLGIDLDMMVGINLTDGVQEYTKFYKKQNIKNEAEFANKKAAKTQAQEYLNQLRNTIANESKELATTLDAIDKNFTLSLNDLNAALATSKASKQYLESSIDERKAIDEVNKKNIDYLLANYKAVKTYVFLQQVSDQVSLLNKILKLNKGMVASGSASTSFEADDELRDALQDMNIRAELKNDQLQLSPLNPKRDDMLINFLPILQKEESLKAYIKAALVKAENTRKIFVTQTDLGKEVTSAIRNEINPYLTVGQRRKLNQRLRRGFESFLNFKAYREATKDRPSPDYIGLMYGKEEGIVNIVNSFLKDNPQFTNNAFLQTLVKNVTPKGFNVAKVNTFGKTNTQWENRIKDSFEDLINSDEGFGIAKSLIDYLVAKDALQFKQGSFRKYIPGYLFNKLSDLRKSYLPLLNEMSDNDYKVIFGTTRDNLAKEFMEMFFRDQANFRAVKRLGKLNAKVATLTEDQQTLIVKSSLPESAKTKEDQSKHGAEAATAMSSMFTIHDSKNFTYEFPRFIRLSQGIFKLTEVNGVDVNKLSYDTPLYGKDCIYQKVDTLGDSNNGVIPYGMSLEQAAQMRQLVAQRIADYKESQQNQSTELSGFNPEDMGSEMDLTEEDMILAQQNLIGKAQEETKAQLNNSGFGGIIPGITDEVLNSKSSSNTLKPVSKDLSFDYGNNKELVLSGDKTITSRNYKFIPNLNIGESGLQTIDGVQFKVTYYGELSHSQVKSKTGIDYSEGEAFDKTTKGEPTEQATKDFINGIGTKHIYKLERLGKSEKKSNTPKVESKSLIKQMYDKFLTATSGAERAIYAKVGLSEIYTADQLSKMNEDQVNEEFLKHCK